MDKLKLLSYCLIVISCNTFGQHKGSVNPSAAYCQEMGYKYEIRKDNTGNDVGLCILPNDSIVDAWDFYKGKVAQEYSYCAKKGYLTKTERKDSAGFITECAICVKKLKSGTEVIPMTELMKKNGDTLLYETEKKSIDLIPESAAYDKSSKLSDYLPESFDWRNLNGHTYIGGIRDQGTCSSCYAFGAISAAEGTFNFAAGKFDNECIDLSEAFVMWCLGSISPYVSHFYGCDGADYEYMELQALCDSGACFESVFPYTMTNPGECTHWNEPRIIMKDWYRVPCLDTTAIKTAIMTYGVVDAAVLTDEDFKNYSEGVYSDDNTGCPGSPCYFTTINHGVSLVGWGHDPVHGLYWILRNSWGASWGENGYMRLKWNSSRILCEVCYLEFYNKPSVTTLFASNLGNASATLNGKVNPNGRLTDYYFEYGTTTGFGNSTSVVSAGTGISDIYVSSDVTGLEGETTYHFRIIAANEDSICYGEIMTFTTGTPDVSTVAATNITESSCISGGNVLSEGASPVTARGVCYGTLLNPTIYDNHTSDGSGVGSFISTLNGLNYNTTYHIRAYATNSVGTNYGNDIVFQTSCGTLNIPYVVDFENEIIPGCWTQEEGLPTWLFIDGNGASNPDAAHGGQYNACLKDESSESNRNKLISPSLNLAGSSNPILWFWHTQAEWIDDQDELRIYYKTSEAGSWNLIETYTNHIPEWTKESIILPDPGSDYYIAFEGDAKWGYGVCIDDIEVFDLDCSSSYTQASDFNVSAIGTNSLDISWTRGNGDEVLVVAHEGSPVDSDPVNGKIYDANAVFYSGEQIGSENYVIYKGTGTQVSVSNLLPGVTYYFSVYESSLMGCITIPALTGNATTTSCPVCTLPFEENFENSTFPPTCWTSFRGTNDLGTDHDWERTTSSTYNSSSGAAYVHYESVSGGKAEDWLVTPCINIPDGPVFSLNFYEKQLFSSYYGSYYYIKVSTSSQNDRESFVNIKSYAETTFGTSYSLRSIDLSSYSGQDIFIAFVMVQDDGDNWYIDNISINDTPAITTVSWEGEVSSDWNEGSNWSDGNIPTIYKNVGIPSGCANYPTVDEPSSCKDLTVRDGGSLIITDGAELNVNGNLAVGSGNSGSFTINDGSCIITGDFLTELDCNINIAGGIISFTNWAKSSSDLWSEGTITLSGGTINASGSIRFSSSYVNGIMNGPFTFNVGDDFLISNESWSTVSGGTINLLGTGVPPFNFWSSNSTSSSVAYNLNIDAPGKTYSLCRSYSNLPLIINNNFTVTAGTAQTYNGTYRLSTFDISGNLTIENGAILDCNGTNDPDINLAGNWINNGGIFIPGNNTVILDGTDQAIMGASTFYNLTKTVTSTAQLTFGSGSSNKTTVTGTLTLQGSSGQLLNLASSTEDSQWEIDPQGNRDLGYLNVKDSKNTNAINISACSLVNSGNNTNWDFPVAAAGTITGTPVVTQGQSGVLYSVPEIAFASSYVWSLPPGATITEGINTSNITVSFSQTAESGEITVRGINTCGSGTISPVYNVTVTPVTGIVELNSEDNVILFPVPVDQILTVKSSSEIVSFEIRRITGDIIFRRTDLNLKMFRLDMNSYNPGIYILNIILRDKPQIPVIRRIVKN